jgi:hypothetical protein
MRSALIGLVVGSLIVAAMSGTGAELSQTPAQLPPVQNAVTVSSAGGLIALGGTIVEGHQQIAVIDTKTYAMTVYHVDQTSGAISLKSVRNIQADLMMDEYNTDSPLPKEIRAILKQRQ